MNSFKKYRKIWVIIFFIVINLINAMMIIRINKANNWLTTPGMTFNSILGNIGFIAVLLSLALIFCSQEKRLMIALVVETIILSVLLIGITMYYEFYKMFPSFYNLTVFNGESSEDALEFIISSIIELSKNTKWIFGLPIVAIVVLYIFINKNNDLHKEISLSSRKYQASIIFLIGVLLLGGSEKFYQQMVKGTWHEENTTVTFRLQAKGVFNFYLGEAIEYFITGEDEPEPEKIEEQLKKLKKYQNDSQISFIDNSEIKNNELYKGIFAGKNLLLIQLESESNFLIGLKVKVGTEYVEVTPNLNRLVDKSIYCNQFYTTVGIGNTSDAEFTAMTGINPNGNRYTVYEYYDQAYETLPKLFREKGYFSFATHANAGFFYSREENFINTYGFDLFLEKNYFEESILDYQDKLVHDWVGDVSFLEQTVKEMKLQKEDTGKAIFSYSITVSNHLPYYLNKEQGFYGQKELLFPHGVEGISENYINYLEHASYNDYAIGKAIEALENEGLADDTVVIIYGDHGCGIDIYEMFYQTPELFINEINPIIEYVEDKNSRDLLEQRFLLNVPFFIYDVSESGKLPPKIISLVRGHESIKRTIANLFGLEAEYYFGVDVLSDAKTSCYNPRNLTILADGIVVSGSSGKRVFTDYYTYKDTEIDRIISGTLEYKNINDKILKYKIFLNK
ncbi:MAG TPA: LTA synthase family protein [Bacilli bacterium]|nr:LTA synthase family protein [Bacilli bacterium]HPL55391.1 LTA synthase family protein [Bacilli bacterium]HQM06730.1 LTA synthase family protein [Bacilli bacterium]